MSENKNTKDLKVFICYGDKDRKKAKKLCDDIGRLVRPLTREDVHVGQYINKGIKKIINESDYFIALFSKNSASKSSSDRGFNRDFNSEIKIAIEDFSERPGNDIFIIPARLDRGDYKELLAADGKVLELQWVDLFPSYIKGLIEILRTFTEIPKQRSDIEITKLEMTRNIEITKSEMEKNFDRYSLQRHFNSNQGLDRFDKYERDNKKFALKIAKTNITRR